MAKLDNPYAPPESDISPRDEQDDSELMDASTGARFMNLIIDSVCRLLFAFLAGMVCGALGIDLRGQAVGLLFGVLTMLVYYVGLEGLFGVTVGKLITGTRVVALDGRRPSFGAVLGRTLSRFVPFEPFSFLGGSSRGWHDTWSGTRVVSVRR